MRWPIPSSEACLRACSSRGPVSAHEEMDVRVAQARGLRENVDHPQRHPIGGNPPDRANDPGAFRNAEGEAAGGEVLRRRPVLAGCNPVRDDAHRKVRVVASEGPPIGVVGHQGEAVAAGRQTRCESALPIRNRHSDGMERLDDQRLGPRERTAQQLHGGAPHGPEGQMAMDYVLAEKPIAPREKPRTEQRVFSEAERALGDVANCYFWIDAVNPQLRSHGVSGYDRHVVARACRMVCKIDRDAFGAPAGERRQDMSDFHAARAEIAGVMRVSRAGFHRKWPLPRRPRRLRAGRGHGGLRSRR